MLAVIYPLVEPLTAADQLALAQVDHRRGLSFLGEALNLPLLDLELDESLALDEDLGGLSMKVSPEDLMLETLNVGDVDADQAMLMTDLDEAPDALGEAEPKLGGKPNGPPAAPPPMAAVRPKSFYYDEWDYHIQDYRRRWCRLMEIHDSDEDCALITRTQCNIMRPCRSRSAANSADSNLNCWSKCVAFAMVKRWI